MTVKRKPNNTYTKEFKLEALRMMDESARSASEIAMQLGIRRNQLYKWKEQMIKKGDLPTAKRGDQSKKFNQSYLKLNKSLEVIEKEKQ
ncbi:MAG: transposase [Gammaproteobacteria bacterium]|nr:transposase [Gammaproteobacteria bacterium]